MILLQLTLISICPVHMFLKNYLVTRFLQLERTFSEEEEQKLQKALSLDKQALYPLSIPLQAVYHNVKPASLKQQFENIHLSPEKAEAFCRAWTTAGPDVVEKVWQRIFTPKKSTQATLKDPDAVLETISEINVAILLIERRRLDNTLIIFQ
uniref:COMM domain containing 10 n=1 Tax=Hucho hucho TaxID=62062 RepID=A0A4W5K6M9_9TELE